VPFYDYVCQACGRRIEVMHSVHATGPERCDACGGRMQRAISRPTIHFKGSGWAKKDAHADTAKVGSQTGSNGSAGGASSAEDAVKEDGGAADATPPKPATSDGGAEATPVAKAERASRRAGSRRRDEA